MRYVYFLKVVTLSFSIMSNAQNKYSNENMSRVNESKFETSDIKITENPQAKYQLEIKDGKPYNGYEVSSETLFGELNFVNFYVNGTLKYKYMIDLKNLDNLGSSKKYDLKTEFENGNPINGYVFKPLNNEFYLAKNYKAKVVDELVLYAFGMHAFEKISFKIENDFIKVSAINTSETLKIYKKDKLLNCDLLLNNNLKASSTLFLKSVTEGSPNSSTFYYLDDKNKVKEFHLERLERKEVQINHEILTALFYQFSFPYDKDIKDFFKELEVSLEKAKPDEFDVNQLFTKYIFPVNPTKIKGSVDYNSKGQIEEGIKIINRADGKFTIQEFESGKKISENIVSSLRDLE